jgi:branched-chain amino acid transport system ATP-binding protein
MAVLEITNLCKFFGGVKAVDDFNLSIQEGNVEAIIGPNGAGKTTIFNLITGIYQPTQGEIKINGVPTVGRQTHEIIKLGISRTFQNIRLFPEANILDNVRTACHLQAHYGILEGLFPTSRRLKEEKEITDHALQLVELVGLQDRINEKARNLPYGHQRRLEIARALALGPKLLLLDEPAAGMNPEETQNLMEFIQVIKEKFNLTILLIEHHMEVVMGLCDQIVVIDFGKTIAQGTPKEIQDNKKVIDAYLGMGE